MYSIHGWRSGSQQSEVYICRVHVFSNWSVYTELRTEQSFDTFQPDVTLVSKAEKPKAVPTHNIMNQSSTAIVARLQISDRSIIHLSWYTHPQSEQPSKAVKCCQLKEARPTRTIEDNSPLSKIAFVIKIQPSEEYILHAANKHQVLTFSLFHFELCIWLHSLLTIYRSIFRGNLR